VFFLMSLCLSAQNKFTLEISFVGFKSDKGNVYVGLHNTEESFLKDRFKETVGKIVDNKAKIVFKDLPKGDYTVSAFHDENNNHKLDTNFIGIPKEPYGISNNAKGFMGPPKYKDARFLVDENKIIQITIE